MDVDSLVEDIRKNEERRRDDAKRVRVEVSSAVLEGGHEEDFIHAVEPEMPNEFSVAGVDGGLSRKEFHGMDLILCRAVATMFHYTNGELTGTDYVPSKNPGPDLETVTGGVVREEVNRLASLIRLRAEVGAALEAVKETDLLLLDGSLLPRMRDRPEKGSHLYGRYDDLLEAYRRLYTRAEESGTAVAGVVEDSRGSRMCNLLKENGLGDGLIEGERDTVILSHLLERGERTLAAPYSDSNTPVLQDVGLGDRFHVFYLRPVTKDRPVRVEFYSTEDTARDAGETASLLMSLCGRGSSYGIPPVLIEADQRAKLGGDEAELLTRRIEARLTHLPGVENLRRERRPF